MRKYKHFFNTMQYKAPKFFAPIIIIMCRHRRAHIEIWHSRLIVMMMRKICIIQRYGRIPYCHFFFFNEKGYIKLQKKNKPKTTRFLPKSP